MILCYLKLIFGIIKLKSTKIKENNNNNKFNNIIKINSQELPATI